MDIGENRSFSGIFKKKVFNENQEAGGVYSDDYVLEKNGNFQGAEIQEGGYQEDIDPDEFIEEQVQDIPEQKKSKKETTDDEKLIHSKTVKFTKKENSYLQDLKYVLGTDKDTKVIRYCVDLIIEYHGDEIRDLAKKKRKAGMINTFK